MKKLLVLFVLIISCKKDFKSEQQVNPEFNFKQNGFFQTDAKFALLKKKSNEVSKDFPVISQRLQKDIDYEPGVINVEANDETYIGRLGKTIRRIFTPQMSKAGARPIYKMQVNDVDRSLMEAKSMGYRAERNAARHTLADTTTLYGMKMIHADVSWNAGNTGDQNVVVAVSDQGIYRAHSKLCGQVWTNPGEIEGNNIDDDGDGYVDDVNGWNFIDRSGWVFMGNDFHATHVSGTIGAKMGGNGIIGVSPNVTLISLKFLDGQGGFGFDDDALESFDYLIMLKHKYNLRIVAVNCSWGGSPFSQFLLDAINRLAAENIVVCCAAGNSNVSDDDPATQMFPASYNQYGATNIISVGACDGNGNKASFSNFGTKSVDLFAPGVGITSTVALTAGGGDGYLTISGTSMATPHVTGAVASYCAGHPNATIAEIKNAILSNVTPTASLVPYCSTGGILNISSFIQNTTNPQLERGCTQPYVDTIPPVGPKITSIYSGPLDSTWTVNWTRGYDPGHETDPLAGVMSTWVFLFDSLDGPNDRYAIIFWPYETGSVTVGTSASPFSDPKKVYGTYLQHPDKFGNWSPVVEYGYARPQGDSSAPPPPPPSLPVINSFTANPSTITIGQSSTLSWTVTGADQITLDGNVVSGNSTVVFPALTTTYTLNAINTAGNVSAQTTVMVTPLPPPPPVDTTINFFTGSGKILSWQVTPAGPVEIQRSQKSGGSFSTIVTTLETSFFITMKPKKWYRVKFGSKISNEIQL